MNIRQLMFLLSVGAFALTGCDQARDIGEYTVGKYDMSSSTSTTLVFAPGYVINMDGQDVSIAGFDECPRQSALMTRIFGHAPNDGDMGCIVLSEDRSRVPVRLFLQAGSVNEEWEIIREAGESEGDRFYQRTALRRPDGTLVVPATL